MRLFAAMMRPPCVIDTTTLDDEDASILASCAAA
jgi:hypothetical protein